MKANTITRTLLIGLAGLTLMLADCGGGSDGGATGPKPPTYNADGLWDVSELTKVDTCGGMGGDAYTYTLGIAHTAGSNDLLITDNSTTFSLTYPGRISAKTITYSGLGYDPSCDTLTLDVKYTMSSASRMSGTINWVCTAAASDPCSGSSTVTAVKEAGISGLVYDYSGVEVDGATVDLKKASDNTTITSATTALDGSFHMNYRAAATEVYLHVSKPGYVSANGEIAAVTASLSGLELTLFDETDALRIANLITGQTGTLWSDPVYSGKSWVVLDAVDSAFFFESDVLFTNNPLSTVFAYNDGLDSLVTPTGPTVGDPTGVNMYGPSAAGYYNAAGTVTVNAAKAGATTQNAKLPGRPGEIAYKYFSF